jgi:hypothetical protein
MTLRQLSRLTGRGGLPGWLAGLVLACGAGAAQALSGTPPGSAEPEPVPLPAVVVLTAASMSMQQAVQMAERRYHAQVVKAEAHSESGRTVYVLRLLNDTGRVWTVRVDAASGVLL